MRIENYAWTVHEMHDKVQTAFTDGNDMHAFTIKAGTSVSHVGPKT